eukprot:scaffold13918_cov132-Amphora_coffeaeformis.AAC.2
MHHKRGEILAVRCEELELSRYRGRAFIVARLDEAWSFAFPRYPGLGLSPYPVRRRETQLMNPIAKDDTHMIDR